MHSLSDVHTRTQMIYTTNKQTRMVEKCVQRIWYRYFGYFHNRTDYGDCFRGKCAISYETIIFAARSVVRRENDACQIYHTFSIIESGRKSYLKSYLTALFTKPPYNLRPYRTWSGGRSVRRFPIDIFPFCREQLVTKELAAL